MSAVLATLQYFKFCLEKEKENWRYNFCSFLYSTILCKRKSDYNILRTGKMLLFSSSMGAMHAYPVAILPIQNKYSKYIALMLMFENSFYMYFVDLEPYWHIKHLKSGRLKGRNIGDRVFS